jgi:hypothetical protein
MAAARSPSASDASASSSSSDSAGDDDPAAAFAHGGERKRRALAALLQQAGSSSHSSWSTFASGFLSNVLARGPSVHRVFHDLQGSFHQERNLKECLSLARLIDALRARDRTRALDLACRRLAGVHAADQNGSWDICDAYEKDTSKQSFVPEKFMQDAVKHALRVKALTTAGSAARSAGFSSAARSSGRSASGFGSSSSARRNDSRPRSRPAPRASAGSSRSGAVSSAKKKGGKRDRPEQE